MRGRRVVLRILREAIHEVREVGGQLGGRFLARLRGARAEAEEARLGGLVAGAQGGVRRLAAGRVVPAQGVQEAPHGDGQQLQTAQLRHRAEHVRGVQPGARQPEGELHARVAAPRLGRRVAGQVLALGAEPQDRERGEFLGGPV